MSTGTGIAIAGIWLSVAVSCFAIGSPGIFLGLFALFATVIIALASV